MRSSRGGGMGLKRALCLLRSRRGVSRLIALLLVLVGIMFVVIAIPVWRSMNQKSARIACLTALDSARRQLAVDFLMVNGTPTAKDAQDVVTYAMNGWDDLCPAGGTVYVVAREDEEGLPYDVVCGIHDPDTKERTRLNASYVLLEVEEAVRRAQAEGEPYPASVTVSLHHEELVARLVDDYTGLRRGTATTADVDGIVAFYSLVGHSDFGAESGLKDGELWYFSYADEEHCAHWSSVMSWTGDSYQ